MEETLFHRNTTREGRRKSYIKSITATLPPVIAVLIRRTSPINLLPAGTVGFQLNMNAPRLNNPVSSRMLNSSARIQISTMYVQTPDTAAKHIDKPSQSTTSLDVVERCC